MSLDVSLMKIQPCEIFTANITHNLCKMAKSAGLYKVLWRPEEIGVKTANDAIPYLREGYANLIRDEDELVKLNPENGWGNYDNLREFTRKYLAECKLNPGASIEVSR